MKYVVGFGRFWYDFIVGDSAILAIGGAAVLIIGSALVHTNAHAAAEVSLPILVTGTLALSLRGTK